MAAAARSNDYERALRDIATSLEVLRSKFQQPSDLERDIIKFESDVKATGVLVRGLREVASPESAYAVEVQFRRLRYAVDGFREFVLGRGDHDEVIHILGRATLGENLAEVLDETISLIEGL